MGTLEHKLPFSSDFEEDRDLLQLAVSIRATAFNTSTRDPNFLVHSGRYTWLLQAARHGYFLSQEIGNKATYIAAIQSFYQRGYGAALFRHLSDLAEPGNHMGLALRMLKVLIATDLEQAHEAIGGDYPLAMPGLSPDVPQIMLPGPHLVPEIAKYLRAA